MKIVAAFLAAFAVLPITGVHSQHRQVLRGLRNFEEEWKEDFRQLRPFNTTTEDPAANSTEICSCTPRAYEFKLNFTGVCPPDSSESVNGGVSNVDCSIKDLGQTPAFLHVDVKELAQDLTTVLKEENVPGTLKHRAR